MVGIRLPRDSTTACDIDVLVLDHLSWHKVHCSVPEVIAGCVLIGRQCNRRAGIPASEGAVRTDNLNGLAVDRSDDLVESHGYAGGKGAAAVGTG